MKYHGGKIVVASLKFFILLNLAFSPLLAKVPLEDKMQEMSSCLEEAQFQINHNKVEIDLFHERLAAMEVVIQKKLDELSLTPKSSNLDGSKLALLEERQKALTQDLGKLGKQQTELISNHAKLETQLAKINKNIAQLLSLLDNTQKPQSYTVQSGDSLGKIAADFHVSVEELKKLNQISTTSDHIYVGQKLRVP